MKAIMISIQPQWVEKILNGEKKIEIRKSMPKCQLPCKVFIYCTQGTTLVRYSGTETKQFGLLTNQVLNGKVIGEFTLKVVDDFKCSSEDFRYIEENTTSCLTFDQICEYSNGQDLFGWYIDDLKIYDEFKNINDFYRVDQKFINKIKTLGIECDGKETLRTPPQSWCYVEI